ncbi:MAG: hypothetical protein ACI35O_14545 [Bacillaceae bacterium]
MENMSRELHERLQSLDMELKKLNQHIPIRLVRSIYDELERITTIVQRYKYELSKETFDMMRLYELEDYELLLKTINEKIDRIIWDLTDVYDREIIDVREDIENMLESTYASSTVK